MLSLINFNCHQTGKNINVDKGVAKSKVDTSEIMYWHSHERLWQLLRQK